MDSDELRTRRERMGLSQAELARRLGMTPRGYHFLERGARKVRPIYALALDRLEQIRAEELRREAADLEWRESKGLPTIKVGDGPTQVMRRSGEPLRPGDIKKGET